MQPFKKYFFLFLILPSLFSCENKPKTQMHNGYTLNGYITSINSGEVYLDTASGKAIDTAIIGNNSFQFLGETSSMQKYELRFKNSDAVVPVWLQNDDVLNAYISPTRSLVYGSKTHNALNKVSEKLQGFKNAKLNIAANYNGNNTESLQQKLDSVSEAAFNYTLSGIKTAEKPIHQFLYKHLNINTLNIEKLTKIKETVAKLENTDWLAQITNKIDTLEARALKLDAIVTIDPSKKYVPYREPAPAFFGPSLQGNDISLASVLQGKKAILVDFWASWCKPCRMLTPQVRAMYNKYHSKGFDIITVSEDRNKASWQQGVAEDNMQAWNHIYDNKMLIASRYGARAIPHMVLIDANGKIIKNKISMRQLERELKKIFK